MDLDELVLLLTRSAATGAANAHTQSGGQTLELSKAQAYRLYGRSNIDRWLAEGLINPIIKKGKPSNSIDRAILERLAARSNRLTYLPVAER